MEIKQAISKIVDRHDLSANDMHAVMKQIMTGGATPIQIGGRSEEHTSELQSR